MTNKNIFDERLDVIRNFRITRENLLSQSDYTQLSDSPFPNKEEWAIYRKKLRDMTEQENFPDTIIWPDKPE